MPFGRFLLSVHNRVHGHAVLEMILGAAAPMTEADIIAKARWTFGENARYYTCSAENMTIEELLQFLVRRQKITLDRGYVTAHRERMCKHD